MHTHIALASVHSSRRFIGKGNTHGFGKVRGTRRPIWAGKKLDSGQGLGDVLRVPESLGIEFGGLKNVPALP